MNADIAVTVTGLCVSIIVYGLCCMRCGKRLSLDDLFMFATVAGATIAGALMAVEAIVGSFGPSPPKTAAFMVIFGVSVSLVSGQRSYRMLKGVLSKKTSR